MANAPTQDLPARPMSPPDAGAQLTERRMAAWIGKALRVEGKIVSTEDLTIDGSVEGVLVTAVAPGSEAEEKSVKPGEVIVQVSQSDVSKPEDVVARIDELKKQGRKTAMLLVSGADKKLRFVSLKIEDAK